jgi:hypothetical protein
MAPLPSCRRPHRRTTTRPPRSSAPRAARCAATPAFSSSAQTVVCTKDALPNRCEALCAADEKCCAWTYCPPGSGEVQVKWRLWI